MSRRGRLRDRRRRGCHGDRRQGTRGAGGDGALTGQLVAHGCRQPDPDQANDASLRPDPIPRVDAQRLAERPFALRPKHETERLPGTVAQAVSRRTVDHPGCRRFQPAIRQTAATVLQGQRRTGGTPHLHRAEIQFARGRRQVRRSGRGRAERRCVVDLDLDGLRRRNGRAGRLGGKRKGIMPGTIGRAVDVSDGHGITPDPARRAFESTVRGRGTENEVDVPAQRAVRLENDLGGSPPVGGGPLVATGVGGSGVRRRSWRSPREGVFGGS